MHNIDLVVELYFKTHEYSKLTPKEFAEEYKRVYAEIREALKNTDLKQTVRV